jgi:hypothetical protein
MMMLPPEIERLARLVAVHTGKAPDVVLREAIESHARIAGIAVAEIVKPGHAIDMERVRKITHRVAFKPLLDTRPPTEILERAWAHPG